MQIVTPIEALSHDFLLYSIFAVSALHLAHLRPDSGRFYTDLAVTCQNRALQSYMAIAPNINETNCGAVLAFSSLVSIYSLALPASNPVAGRVQDDLEAATSWMRLTRGVGSVVVAVREGIRKSKFELLLHGHMSDAVYPLPEDCAAVVDRLPTLWMSSSTSTSEQLTFDDTFRLLKSDLGVVHNFVSIQKCDLGMALSWSGRVTPEFVALLAARKPVALVILAYFCVVLDAARDFWCIDVMPARLIRSVHALLDDNYRAWIRWPMEAIQLSLAQL